MKSVLLSGYYGFGNLCDELMLKNIARIFKETGSSFIYAVSGNVEYSRAKRKCSGEFIIAKLPLKIICKLYEWHL
jgi:polysaccharide pyruvyl transferase WcaK-like protein